MVSMFEADLLLTDLISKYIRGTINRSNMIYNVRNISDNNFDKRIIKFIDNKGL